MSTVSSTFKKSDNLLSVTLYDSALVKEGEHVGRVTRNTVSLENLIAEISEDNTGLDPFVVQHSAILLQQQMLKMLRQGKGVNILDLGTMYIALKGTVKGDKPDAADIPELMIKFTPSALANEALENIVIDKIVFSESSPQIDVIIDLWTGVENQYITPGKMCSIRGSKLKLGGDEYSLKFIPLDENGEEDLAASDVPVDIKRISKNTNGMLEFFIPEELADGKSYKIRITTSYLNLNTSRKTPVVTDTDALIVKGSSKEASDPIV